MCQAAVQGQSIADARYAVLCCVCRALALTIEELRALLALVLGASDLVLLYALRALADEQLTADKVTLNLQVLRKQVCNIFRQI
jgi:hypothetical protein